MTAHLIDGKTIAAQLRENMKIQVANRQKSGQTIPGLAVIMVGDNPASAVYVKNKRKACEEVGINSFAYDLPAATTQEELNKLIDQLNENTDVHGLNFGIRAANRPML